MTTPDPTPSSSPTLTPYQSYYQDWHDAPDNSTPAIAAALNRSDQAVRDVTTAVIALQAGGGGGGGSGDVTVVDHGNGRATLTIGGSA